jgi:ribosomal protein S18 acetylase RimI-like enzyme
MVDAPNSPSWTLRPATAADRGFLFELNRQTMREYVEAVWGWDDAFQARFFDEHFVPDGSRQIIQVDGCDVGMVEVLPEWQGRGIGTSVVRSVLARGQQGAKPVVLRVLRVNQRARRLYEREGFEVVSETETHFRMVHVPTV